MTIISVGRNGKEIGDYDLPGVTAGLASGYFLASDFGWYAGLPEWRSLPDIVRTLGVLDSISASAATPPTTTTTTTVAPLSEPQAPSARIKTQKLTPTNGVVTYVLKESKRKKRPRRIAVTRSWRDDPATEKQITFLADLKVGTLPANLTKGQAHDLIEARLEGHQFLSPKQMACLSYHGFNPSSLGADEAKELLDQIHEAPARFSVPEPWETAKYHLYPNLYPSQSKPLVPWLIVAFLVIVALVLAAILLRG